MYIRCEICGKAFEWEPPAVTGIACEECFAKLCERFEGPVERLLSDPAVQAAIEADDETTN